MGKCHTFQVQSLENSLSPSVTSDSTTLGIVAHQVSVLGVLQARILECVAIYFTSLENGFSSVTSSWQRSFTKEPA